MPFRKVGTVVADIALGLLGIGRRQIASNTEGSGRLGWRSGERGAAAVYGMGEGHTLTAMNPVDGPPESETILVFPRAVERVVDNALLEASEKWKRQVEG